MPKDLQQEASLAKKRYMDLCRQGRVFDARNRTIGVSESLGTRQRGAQALVEALYGSTKFGWIDLEILTCLGVSQQEPVLEEGGICFLPGNKCPG